MGLSGTLDLRDKAALVDNPGHLTTSASVTLTLKGDAGLLSRVLWGV